MKLHLGNLPKTLSEADLRTMIVAFAEPTSLEIIKDSTGTSKGFGFAAFESDEKAQAVITGLDGKDVEGQTLKIGQARPRKGDPVEAPATPQA